MASYSLMTLVMVGVRYAACSPTPLDDLTINLNLREAPEDEGSTDYETFDEDQELKAGQNIQIIPVVVGGAYVENGISFLQQTDEFYRPSSGQWENMPNPLARERLSSSHGVATLYDSIYKAGGQGKMGHPLKSVFRRFLNRPWVMIKNSLNVARTFPTLTTVEFQDVQTLVVTGGEDIDKQPLNSVEIFQSKDASWIIYPRTEMKEARSGHAAVQFDKKLYVLGGITNVANNKPSETTEFFDPVTLRWAYAHPMKEKRSFHGATVLGENIYICGGQKVAGMYYEVLQTCEYGNGQGPYTLMENMKYARTQFAMLTVGQEIWAIGGLGGLPPNLFDLNTVEKYDPAARKWTELESKLQRSRYLFGATTVNASGPQSLESANRIMNNRTG